MTTQVDKNAFAKRLIAARAAAGMSQIELSRRVGVHSVTANKWERGERLPSTDDIVSISRVLSVPIEELLLGSDGGERMKEPDMVAFFNTPEGQALTREQKYGLAKLLTDKEVADISLLRAAVRLLFGDPKQ